MSATTIDQATCKRCGACAAICPNATISQPAGEAARPRPGREHLCIACGHCMAVCPARAITVAGMSYERDFTDLPSGDVATAPFLDLIQSRRSIRNFADRPVPREALDRIVEAISLAPMGYPPHKTCLSVVTDRAVLAEVLGIMVDSYADLVKYMANPLIGPFIRLGMNAETRNTLTQLVLPEMKVRLPEVRSGAADNIMRGAPAMILFHADRQAPSHTEDGQIALTYGLLAAHALGLGATDIGLIPPSFNRSARLRALGRVPDGHVVGGALILGYPRYQFHRGIRRELAAVNWI